MFQEFMKSIYFFIIGYFFNFVQAQKLDESISFSQTSQGFLQNSYWYGKVLIGKNRSFLEEGINMKINLNKYQGLLFYIIDSNYQTLWLEFSANLLVINYYNFKINESEKRTFKISFLLGNNRNGIAADLSLSYAKNEVKIYCNDKFQIVDYLQPMYPIPESDLKKFIETFTMPIPFFNNSTETTEVHVWIGNTPKTNNKFQNIAQLRINHLNLLGCVEQFSIQFLNLKLATSGERVGEMIEPVCKPVCNSSSCYNQGKCYELWRGNYECDCEYSQFIGRRCELEYSIKFNGSFSVTETRFISFKRLRFSFRPDLAGEYYDLKLLSLKLKEHQYFVLYIDSNSFMRGRLIYSYNLNIDVSFKFKLKHNQTFIFMAEVVLNEIQMKIYNSQNHTLIETQFIILEKISIDFKVKQILFADLHIPFTDSMKRFKGCLTNFVLQSETKQFILNTSRESTNYPQCEQSGKFMSRQSLYKKPNKFTEELPKHKIIEKTRSVNEKKNNYTAYILITVVSSISLFIVVVVIVLCKFHLRKANLKQSFQVKENTRSNYNYPTPIDKSNEYKQFQLLNNGDATDSFPCPVYPSPICMTFKPAYKAKSMCSSITNGSLLSLPVTPSPTLAVPEDREKLQ